MEPWTKGYGVGSLQKVGKAGEGFSLRAPEGMPCRHLDCSLRRLLTYGTLRCESVSLKLLGFWWFLNSSIRKLVQYDSFIIVSIIVLLSWGCRNQVPRTEIFIVSQFGGWTSKTKMAAGLVLLDGPEGSLSGLSPWLADGRLLPLSSHCLPAVCVSVSKSPLSMRIPIIIGLRSTLMTSVEPISVKILSSNKTTLWATGLGL